MRFVWVWVAAVVLGSLSLGGCSKGETDELEEHCSDACSGWERCNQTGPDCTGYCTSHYDPPDLRPGVLRAVGKCMKTESCSVLASDQPATACFDEAAETMPLTQSVLDYCRVAAHDLFECNVWWGVDECVVDMKLWADEVLEDSRQCLSLPCDEINDCQKAVFESHQ